MNSSLAAPKLESDALAEARSFIGKEIRVEQWNYEASRDCIRHYAWGLGDDNPLWCDPAYARTTRYGGIIAPPTFLYSIFDAVVAPGLPDIQWIYSGTDWTFNRVVKVGEEITAKAKATDARELSGKLVNRMLVQTGEVTYSDAAGKTVGTALSHCFRIARASADGGLSYKGRSQPRYTEAELLKIEDAMVNEFVRGRDILYWDDVKVGDETPQILRGPLSRLDMTCYYAGSVGTSGYKASKLKFKYAHLAKHNPEKLPNNYDPSYYAAAISPSIGHQDESVAQSEIGMPNAYDNGPQRIGMLSSCVTNWMGDDAEMKTLIVRLRLPVIFGDILSVKAKVVEKLPPSGDRGIVKVEIKGENQLGETVAVGTATVALLRR